VATPAIPVAMRKQIPDPGVGDVDEVTADDRRHADGEHQDGPDETRPRCADAVLG